MIASAVSEANQGEAVNAEMQQAAEEAGEQSIEEVAAAEEEAAAEPAADAE